MTTNEVDHDDNNILFTSSSDGIINIITKLLINEENDSNQIRTRKNMEDIHKDDDNLKMINIITTKN